MKFHDAFGSGGPKTVAPQSSSFAEMMKEAEPELNEMGIGVDYESGVGEFNKMEDGQVKKIKIGRNDPCPCGSGKKYKKCHGKTGVGSMPNKRNRGAIIVYAPEEFAADYNDVYWAYGSDDGLVYTKKKEKGIDSKQVKVRIIRNNNEQTSVIIFDNFLYEVAPKLPGAMEIEDMVAFMGVFENNGDLVVFVN